MPKIGMSTQLVVLYSAKGSLFCRQSPYRLLNLRFMRVCGLRASWGERCDAEEEGESRGRGGRRGAVAAHDVGDVHPRGF
jgi:hypothetical protein